METPSLPSAHALLVPFVLSRGKPLCIQLLSTMTSVTFTERFRNKACPQFSVIDFNQVSVSCGLIPFRHEKCIKGEGCLLRAYDPFGAGIYLPFLFFFFFPRNSCHGSSENLNLKSCRGDHRETPPMQGVERPEQPPAPSSRLRRRGAGQSPHLRP